MSGSGTGPIVRFHYRLTGEGLAIIGLMLSDIEPVPHWTRFVVTACSSVGPKHQKHLH
jgi:hypothetical protein